MALRPTIPEVEFRLLQDVNPWLTSGVQDWAVLLGLFQFKPYKVHGFVTSDDSMLNLSRTLPVLRQTDLTLMVCQGQGHDPIAATGLLLLHCPYVARRWTSHAELVVVRHPGQKANELEPWIAKLAVRAKTGRSAYLRANELKAEELGRPLQEWYAPTLEL